MRTLIIENEKSASELLSAIITDYYPSLELLGVETNIKDAFQAIRKLQPELIFLDIELDDGLSFELLDLLQTNNFRIIFTTAYDQYALKAFRYDAVDYILKPYSPKSVVDAVQRVMDRENSVKSFDQLNELITEKVNSISERISFQTGDGIRLCKVDEIVRLEASSSYCMVFLEGGEKLLISKPLGDIEKKLPESEFYRVHASHTVNVGKVKKVIHQDGGYIELLDGKNIPLSRRRKQEFINLIK